MVELENDASKEYIQGTDVGQEKREQTQIGDKKGMPTQEQKYYTGTTWKITQDGLNAVRSSVKG